MGFATMWVMTVRLGLAAVACLVAVGCVASTGDLGEDPVDVLGTDLSRAQRRARLEAIRDIAAGRGLINAWPLAGIADAETGLAHCWQEATWACRGPDSAACDGGPVIAGAGDGPCALREGGLGMFQFDAGDFDETLAREGRGILEVEGNVDAAVDFVLDMTVRSQFIDGVSNRAEAIDWLNDIRPRDRTYGAWIKTVTSYYNGCFEGRCRVYEQRYRHYDKHHQTVLREVGEAFFFGATAGPPPAPVDRCGDDRCSSDESCDDCPEDCGMCRMPPIPERRPEPPPDEGETPPIPEPRPERPGPGCGVEGHQGDHDSGESCSAAEAWRCVYSPRLDSTVSQVCRNGRWLNFHLQPQGCGTCCGEYSTDCRQRGS